jgi:hypothetical protein
MPPARLKQIYSDNAPMTKNADAANKRARFMKREEIGQ